MNCPYYFYVQTENHSNLILKINYELFLLRFWGGESQKTKKSWCLNQNQVWK